MVDEDEMPDEVDGRDGVEVLHVQFGIALQVRGDVGDVWGLDPERVVTPPIHGTRHSNFNPLRQFGPVELGQRHHWSPPASAGATSWASAETAARTEREGRLR